MTEDGFQRHEVERKKRGDGQWETEVGRIKIKQVKYCNYIDEETFQRLDDSYEQIFAMLYSMENKADAFCLPSSICHFRGARRSNAVIEFEGTL